MAKKDKKKKKVHIGKIVGLIIKITIAMLLLVIIVGGLLIYRKYGKRILGMEADAKRIVAESNADTFRQTETGFIYDSDGNIISRLKGEKDVYYISYTDIPKNAVNAIVSIEDKKFFKHKGYDALAILRAAFAYIKNRGTITQGGSTITQQLARNIFLSFEATWERKAREIFIAMELEKKYSKEEIMEFYLNNIYFANGYYGIQSASFGYFGKGAGSLSLSQIAFLLSIPNGPVKYDPYDNFEGTLGRRDRILDQMLKDGKISAEECEKAKAEKIKIKDMKSAKSSYVETFALECAVKSLMKANGFLFRYSFASDDEEKTYKEGYSAVYAEWQQRLYSGGYRVYTSIDPEKQKKLQAKLDEGLSISKEKSAEGIYKLQGSAVTIDNETGRVVAVVGGRSQNLIGRTLNRAYQSFRQPGSTIKPLIVYTPAFERGFDPLSVADDKKIKGGPVNADGVFSGKMTLIDAVVWSKNTIAWKLFTEISPKAGIGKLLEMNFSNIEDTDFYPAAALGGFTKGVSVLEMTSAYAAIENAGEFREPDCIVKITDSQGRDIITDGFYGRNEYKYVYDEKASKMMTTCMEEVMKRGTGKGGRLAKMPCAGKTGTTNDAKDLWFVGFTKYYTTGIWVGYDMPKSLNNLPLTATPLSIWKSYMEDIHTGLEIKALDAYKLPKKIEEKPEKTEKEPPEENPVEPPSDDTEITDDQIDTGETEDNTDDNDETDEGENPEEGNENPDEDEAERENGENPDNDNKEEQEVEDEENVTDDGV